MSDPEKQAVEKKPKLEEQIIVWDTEKGEVKLSVALVRMYFCPEASTVEAMTFLSICKYQKLNPWLREAYLIKYGNFPASIVVGKDTFSKRAVRNPKYQGFHAGIIVKAGEATERREGSFITKTEELLGGWCKVLMKDREPILAEVSLTEYEGRTKEGNLNRTWHGKSATMIRKVAYVQAHREAMPEEFEGLYDEAEIRHDEKRPEPFGMPLSVAEAAAKEQAAMVGGPGFGNGIESPAAPPEPVKGENQAGDGSPPAGDVPPDDEALAQEARAREQAEAAEFAGQGQSEQPKPTGKVDRGKVWNAVLRKAKAEGKTAGRVLHELTGRQNMPELDDKDVLALAKKLEAP